MGAVRLSFFGVLVASTSGDLPTNPGGSPHGCRTTLFVIFGRFNGADACPCDKEREDDQGTQARPRSRSTARLPDGGSSDGTVLVGDEPRDCARLDRRQRSGYASVHHVRVPHGVPGSG